VSATPEQRVDGTHIYFDFVTRSRSGKTLEYHVMARDGSDCLGSVNWFGRWRCYVFNPWPGTVFEQKCLREIAEFCDRLTKEHRASWRAGFRSPTTVKM
jgi:hypothetical protein